MIKKFMASAAVAASVVGVSAATAPQALALGDDHGPASATGNGAAEAFGNTTTHGNMSPQIGLIQGSFNKPCIAFYKIPIALVDDIPILSDQQNMQCTENASQDKGDQSLSHLLENVPVLSENGVGNH
ncbi:rodlin [Streptomyces sclerotialus]|uniref:rodlin n=1 Tax=Streptomyces sclerotialus TaxID=1957 RepID=UPI0004C5F1AA